MAVLMPQGRQQYFDNAGNPLVNGKLYTWAAGTGVPKQTFTDAAGTVPNTNPIIMNARGECTVFWSGAYKAELQTAAGGTIWTQDNIVDMMTLLATSSGPSGSSFIGLKRSFAGSVATTLYAWHEAQMIDLVADVGADATGAVDCTIAFQAAVTAGNVRVPAGNYTLSWAAMSSDISIPSNRKILIEKGATLTVTGARFTADDKTNVEWEINGWIKSVAMRTAASKPAWTALVGDRGFIEFGSTYSAGTAASGFSVSGTGRVSGDWTGTPNYSDPVNQTNRKGIASWNAKNVYVGGLEVYGFDGEAVYACFFDTASHNIVFERNNIHDTRFNALNFNAGANGGGCIMRNNRVKTAFSNELSVGEATDNYVESMVGMGIWTGVGSGLGPLVISRNVVKSCGSATDQHGIAAVFAPGTPVTDIDICDNTVIDSYGYSIYTDYTRELVVRGNKCKGTGQGGGSYDIGINHCLRGSVSENTFTSPGAFAQPGRIAVDANSFDVSISPTSNVYLPTTGTATPRTGNGVITVASAAALPIPALGSIFLISGVTNITSIVPAVTNSNNDGREITLIFAGILTFTDGSNLKLAGNFVTTADDTITLVCDGTNWFERGRSVN